MSHLARTQVPILDLIAQRRSPRAFQDRPVEHELIVAMLEAARWAASSRNSQPWNFIVATREEPEEYARLLSCLNERNQSWAGQAPVLMLAVAAVVHPDGGHNRFAWHDVGLAVGNLTIQAMSTGLMLRQMGGFNRDLACEIYHIPETYEPVTAIAIGYPADSPDTTAIMQTLELSPRIRKPLREFVFSGRWGESAALIDE